MENETINEEKIIETNVDYKDMYLRALADYQNLKRTSENAKNAFMNLAIIAFVRQLLPIVDDIEAGANTGDIAMNAIYRKLIILLSEMNVIQFGREDKVFDPKYHNAISTEFDQNKEENELIEVKRYGYKLNEHIIRFADVVVNKKPQE